MAQEITKTYTKTGDNGTTSLGNGERVSKDCIRVEALGAVNELNSAIGLIMSTRSVPAEIQEMLSEIQHELYDLSTEIHAPHYDVISTHHVQELELLIDQLTPSASYFKSTILATGGAGNATAHMAKAICQRAERRLVSLQQQESINKFSLQYLNRLSDLLHVVAHVLGNLKKNRARPRVTENYKTQ